MIDSVQFGKPFNKLQSGKFITLLYIETNHASNSIFISHIRMSYLLFCLKIYMHFTPQYVITFSLFK